MVVDAVTIDEHRFVPNVRQCDAAGNAQSSTDKAGGQGPRVLRLRRLPQAGRSGARTPDRAAARSSERPWRPGPVRSGPAMYWTSRSLRARRPARHRSAHNTMGRPRGRQHVRDKGIWHSCDVGNGSADGAVLFFCFLLTRSALSSQWGVTLKMLGGKSIAGACAVAFCAAAGICWGLIAWIGVLDSCPAPVCPGNIPPWWPGFVPA